MPLLREVWVWPPSGFPDRPWVDDPDRDAFVKVSRAVCDRYCEALPGLAVTHRTSHLRVLAEPWDGPRAPADTDPGGAAWTVFEAGIRQGFEVGVVGVPAGFATWPRGRQQEVVLGSVHGLVTTMARVRGLHGADRLDAAAEHVRAHGFGFSWDGPWHRSPRKGPFAARCRYVLEADGYGRMTLEVAALDDGGEPGAVAASEGHLAWTTSAGFLRSDRSLRWHDARYLTVVPATGVGGLAGATLHVGVSPGAGPGDPPSIEVSHGEPLAAPRRPNHVVRRLAADAAPAVRRAVAARTTVDPDVLRILADDPDVKVRTAVAANAATPPDVVLRLAGDPAWQVHFAAGDRPDLTEEMLDTLCRDGHDSMREFLAGSDRLPLGPSHRLAADPVATVRIMLANVSPHREVLDRLAADPNRTVRDTLRRRRG